MHVPRTTSSRSPGRSPPRSRIPASRPCYSRPVLPCSASSPSWSSAPDLVFNLIEGFAGKTVAETYVTSLFELSGIPYTGSPVEAMGLCHSKAQTKAILRGYGLPTASFIVVGESEPVPRLDTPMTMIVKPEAEDSSLGIDQESVITDPGLLPARVERLRREYGGSVLIETYLSGPEFNVGVIATPDPKPLPIAQVAFADRPVPGRS